LAVKFRKGQILYLSGIAEFEGQSLPVVIPAKVATCNPQRDGSFQYHVHVWEPTRGRGSMATVGAKYNCPEGDLHDCPVSAMEKAIEAADAGKVKPFHQGGGR
jgi:hypothetical protein